MATKKRRKTKRKAPVARRATAHKARKASSRRSVTTRKVARVAKRRKSKSAKRSSLSMAGYAVNPRSAKLPHKVIARGKLIAGFSSPALAKAFARAYANKHRVQTMTGRHESITENPLPASSSAVMRLGRAFSGRRAVAVKGTRKWPANPDAVFAIGKLEGLIYQARVNGRSQKFIHRFASAARPMLAVGPKGHPLHLVGGKYRFTERGIVDRTGKE